MIASGEMDRNLLNPFMVDLALIKMRKPGKFKLNSQRLEELIFGKRPESDQDLPKAPPLGLLKINRLKQFGFGQAEFVFEIAPNSGRPLCSSFTTEHQWMVHP